MVKFEMLLSSNPLPPSTRIKFDKFVKRKEFLTKANVNYVISKSISFSPYSFAFPAKSICCFNFQEDLFRLMNSSISVNRRKCCSRDDAKVKMEWHHTEFLKVLCFFRNESLNSWNSSHRLRINCKWTQRDTWLHSRLIFSSSNWNLFPIQDHINFVDLN